MPLLAIALLAWGLATTGFVADASAAGRAELLARQRALVAVQADGQTTPPFAVETQGDDRSARGNVFTTVSHDFAALADALARPSSWCEIAPLHLNVKSCTWSQTHDGARITLYSGRKTYEPPEDTHVSPYVFERIEGGDDYLRVLLTADEGPLDTRDYVIELEAIPAGEGESFVHLRYAYRYGLKTRLAMAGYFATLGSGKVGFSVVGADAQGNAVYVGGVEGMIERNAVRYQLAIQAYLDTREEPESVRFERRIERWFALTERHRRQLYELDRGEYLQNKRREHSDQVRLQRAAAAETLRP
jgi:hypothetical protein